MVLTLRNTTEVNTTGITEVLEAEYKNDRDCVDLVSTIEDSVWRTPKMHEIRWKRWLCRATLTR